MCLIATTKSKLWINFNWDIGKCYANAGAPSTNPQPPTSQSEKNGGRKADGERTDERGGNRKKSHREIGHEKEEMMERNR